MYSPSPTNLVPSLCRMLSRLRVIWLFAVVHGFGFVAIGPAAVATSPDDASHQAQNPVYAQLVAPRTDASERDIRLPPPQMPDGYSESEQREVLRQVAGDRYDVADLLRPSAVAPHVLTLQREPLGNGDDIIQRIDVAFVGQGNLDVLTQEAFLASLLPIEDDESTPEETENDVGELSAEDFAAAGVDGPPRESEEERYRRFQTMLLDRIRLSGVMRAYWTQTDDSILFAALVDDRFAAVDDLRPAWERFQRQPDGQLAPAESGTFAGGGMYIKITRLREPADSLFFESHGMLIEPRHWFDGANLLGSKLPPAIQSQVRDVRRRAVRAADTNHSEESDRPSGSRR